jgi:hypothetical protein
MKTYREWLKPYKASCACPCDKINCATALCDHCHLAGCECCMVFCVVCADPVHQKYAKTGPWIAAYGNAYCPVCLLT